MSTFKSMYSISFIFCVLFLKMNCVIPLALEVQNAILKSNDFVRNHFSSQEGACFGSGTFIDHHKRSLCHIQKQRFNILIMTQMSNCCSSASYCKHLMCPESFPIIKIIQKHHYYNYKGAAHRRLDTSTRHALH